LAESALVEEIRAKRDSRQADLDAAENARILRKRGSAQSQEARHEQELEDVDRAELEGKRLRVVRQTPRLDAVNDGAGFLLGLVGYALLLNYLRGGLPAVRGWFAAKFLNIPYTGELGDLAPAAPAAPASQTFGTAAARAFVTRRVF
jgi:hypothetical protein